MTKAPKVLAEFDEEVIPFKSWAGRHRLVEAASPIDGSPLLKVQIWREEEGGWKTEGLGNSSAQAVVYALGRVLGWTPRQHEPAAALPRITARPRKDWHEDIGPVLWWWFPIQEAPYVGTPLDTEWPGDEFCTHWTHLAMLPVPAGEVG